MNLVEPFHVTELERLVRDTLYEKSMDAMEASQLEQAVMRLSDVYLGECSGAEKILLLIKRVQRALPYLPKAKAGNMFKLLLEKYLESDAKDMDLAIGLCHESIAWATQEKRSFLRQGIEARLIELYLLTRKYVQATEHAGRLVLELRKIDDKLLLIDVLLLESQAYYYLHNFPKARASLTAARTVANTVYCAPHLQGALDLQAGILHTVDKDFSTAFSYFFEAHEGLDTSLKAALNVNKAKFPTQSAMASTGASSTRAVQSKIVLAIKYMLMCKIMLDLSDEALVLIQSKFALACEGSISSGQVGGGVTSHLEAMAAIAKAYQQRSLAAFERAKREYPEQIVRDPMINQHLTDLYGKMVEQNLLKLIEPYSHVELDFLQAKIDLDRHELEARLSAMILDEKLTGILDQGTGVLITFKKPEEDALYLGALKTIHAMSTVVDALHEKAQASLFSL